MKTMQFSIVSMSPAHLLADTSAQEATTNLSLCMI